ncbi:restriction endonuclease subunit S [Agreia sp. VKM Ac-1783]|uniref:restriction endonuclease subunit S n=1 Tax=Agreia sp. VKM Ac-1783 TaxID=1938889 RepID=UPI000A2AD705|nr:restriction endonuclease subunit S [Agreia sp. VKM Ac-1783]SMQ70957.1 type I restriction enzyme, S subunit [Agreia sp. VKM Ac-1783]
MTPKRYPTYRESGIEWLGAIPQVWKTASLKRNTYIKGRVGWKGLTSDEFEIESDAYLVTGSDFSGRVIDWTKCYQVTLHRYEDDPFIQLRNGDLLITKDGTIGKTSLVDRLDKPACLNSGIFLVRPLADYTSDFLYWVLNSTVFRHFVELTSSGSTIQHLYQNVFETFAFGFPGLDDQYQISRYLDAQTVKIDLLIEKQERLIDTLVERRQALISHAVTKGLDPNVPLRETAYEWIKSVPVHWKTAPFIRLATSQVDYRGATPTKTTEGIQLLTARNVKKGYIDRESSREFVAESEYSTIMRRGQPEIGDVLLTMEAPLGNVALVDDVRVALAQRIVKFRLDPGRLLSKYANYLLNGYEFQQQILSKATGSTAPGLKASKLIELMVAVPPLEEQRSIVEMLDSATAKIDALSAKAREMIDVLRERRLALITAAVTGKIDVRGLS